MEERISFTLDELLQVLQEKNEPPDFFTRAEWQEKLGIVSRLAMLRLLRQAKKRGILTTAQVHRECVDGVKRVVSAYRFNLEGRNG